MLWLLTTHTYGAQTQVGKWFYKFFCIVYDL